IQGIFAQADRRKARYAPNMLRRAFMPVKSVILITPTKIRDFGNFFPVYSIKYYYLCQPFKKVLMNSKREFDIAFVGLKPGVHEYTYDITDRFFEAYQSTEFSNCAAQVKLSLDKKNGFMLLKFEIGGKVDLSCDRCGSTSLP